MDQFAYIADNEDYVPGDPGTITLMVWRSHWFLQQWMIRLHRMAMSDQASRSIPGMSFAQSLVELDDFDLTLYDRDRLTAKLQGQYNSGADSARDNRFIELARYHLSQNRRVFYFSDFGDEDE